MGALKCRSAVDKCFDPMGLSLTSAMRRHTRCPALACHEFSASPNSFAQIDAAERTVPKVAEQVQFVGNSEYASLGPAPPSPGWWSCLDVQNPAGLFAARCPGIFRPVREHNNRRRLAYRISWPLFRFCHGPRLSTIQTYTTVDNIAVPGPGFG